MGVPPLSSPFLCLMLGPRRQLQSEKCFHGECPKEEPTTKKFVVTGHWRAKLTHFTSLEFIFKVLLLLTFSWQQWWLDIFLKSEKLFICKTFS